MYATVDPELCIGCEVCTEICPHVFHMEDGKAAAATGAVAPSDAADCRQAAEECPVTAITVTA